MEPLTQEFVDSCREEEGFKLRGENMTRIEVFVDAAFAFAVTMLVISIDEIPSNIPELLEVSKGIPAFAVSVLQLMWIWSTHSTWSKRFGLEDGTSIFMSVLLIILVLIYIYPLKIMFSGFFAWATGGYLPSSFELNSFQELRIMFLYFALGFITIFLIYFWMYKHALSLQEKLRLTKYEIHKIGTQIRISILLAGVGVISAIIPFLLSDKLIALSGFSYALIGVVYHFVETSRNRLWETSKE